MSENKSPNPKIEVEMSWDLFTVKDDEMDEEIAHRSYNFAVTPEELQQIKLDLIQSVRQVLQKYAKSIGECD